MRFRIEISLRDPEKVWIADVFDLMDHGAKIAYATVSGPDLLTVMKHASHYVFVAGCAVDDVLAHVNEKLDELSDLVRDVGAHGTYDEPRHYDHYDS